MTMSAFLLLRLLEMDAPLRVLPKAKLAEHTANRKLLRRDDMVRGGDESAFGTSNRLDGTSLENLRSDIQS